MLLFNYSLLILLLHNKLFIYTTGMPICLCFNSYLHLFLINNKLLTKTNSLLSAMHSCRLHMLKSIIFKDQFNFSYSFWQTVIMVFSSVNYSNLVFCVTFKGYLDKNRVGRVMCHPGDGLKSLRVKDCCRVLVRSPIRCIFFLTLPETIKVKTKLCNSLSRKLFKNV